MQRTIAAFTASLALTLGATLLSDGLLAQSPEEMVRQGAEAPAGRGQEGPPKTFADAIKDRKKIDGLFPVYFDEKNHDYLMAIKPEQLEQDFMVSIARDTGIGESFILATMDLGENPIYFRKVGKTIQMLLRNDRFTAHEDPEMARAVGRSFSDSLIGSTRIVGEPDNDTKAVLVDMKPFFINDVEGLTAFLSQFQAIYMVDPRNSYFTDVTSDADSLEVGARIHLDGKKPANFVNLVDPRSMFVTYRYSIGKIPSTPGYVPRIADDRVGNFITMYRDFSDDTKPTSYMRYITRWDLRKEEPYAPVSRPVKPITFWLENGIPKQYRKAVADGVLVWNKAFEKIGFKDAVVVKEQPDDANWDPADSRYASVRWFVTTTSSFAIGPSRINPWTGEIFDADIGVSEAIVRHTRSEFREMVDPLTAMQALADGMRSPMQAGERARDPRKTLCSLGEGIAQQAAFGRSLLMTRGVQPGSPEEDQYINDFITHVMAHEVGHTLGLRHNFRASNLHAVGDLQNLRATTEKGLTGSVMDYIPVNIAAKNQTQGQYWQTTLGPYDYWAIEYAYAVNPGIKTPEDERGKLEEIASRVADSDKAYGTDEDLGDPVTNLWDIGSDDIQYFQNRISLANELWSSIPTQMARDGEGYQVMRRAFTSGLFEYVPAVLNVSKMIGGVHTYRDHVGDPGGRLPMRPVSAERQRQALEFVRKNVFASDAFRLSPDLLNRLAADRWPDFTWSVFSMQRLEFPIHNVVLNIQSIVLNDLYDTVKLDSMVDLERQFPPNEKAFTMMEMFQGVQSAAWSEVYGGTSPRIDSFRRGLQRVHLGHMTRLALVGSEGVPEDARTMARYSLIELKGKIGAIAGGMSGLDAATRAHLDESLARIDAALKAQSVRMAG